MVFRILSAQKDSSEAYVLTTLVPYVQNTYKPRDT